jgi:hypothetical protein
MASTLKTSQLACAAVAGSGVGDEDVELVKAWGCEAGEGYVGG